MSSPLHSPVHSPRAFPLASPSGNLNNANDLEAKYGGRDQKNRVRTSSRRGVERRSGSFAVEGDLRAQLEWLRESEGGGDGSSAVGPPSLHVDGRTVLEEIRDIRCLRRGDHCCVGLNVFRRLHWVFDWLTFTAARWECLKLYHHFVMMDDVVALAPAVNAADITAAETAPGSVTTEVSGAAAAVASMPQEDAGQEPPSSSPKHAVFPPSRFSLRASRLRAAPCCCPVRSDGQPARICEYGTTAEDALRLLFRHGLRKHGLWRLMAPFQTLALSDYVENSGSAGIFRVKPVGPPLTDQERDAIVREAEALCSHYEPYDLFWRNCESAAFSLSPRTRRWVSPEVPNTWWNIFRAAVAACGAALLAQAHPRSSAAVAAAATGAAAGAAVGRACAEAAGAAGAAEAAAGMAAAAAAATVARAGAGAVEGFCAASPAALAAQAPWFHLLVTVPAGLQVLVELVRATVHLTEQRHGPGGVGDRTYHHLLAKEVGRGAFVGGLLLAGLGHLPAWVAADPSRAPVATFAAVFAYPVANAVYGLLARGMIEVFKRLCGGVPVFTFFYGSQGGAGFGTPPGSGLSSPNGSFNDSPNGSPNGPFNGSTNGSPNGPFNGSPNGSPNGPFNGYFKGNTPAASTDARATLGQAASPLPRFSPAWPASHAASSAALDEDEKPWVDDQTGDAEVAPWEARTARQALPLSPSLAMSLASCASVAELNLSH